MSYITIEIQKEQEERLLTYYKKFMFEKKSKAESYNSLDEFKQSATYQNLPKEEKEQLKQSEGKNVMVLVFSNCEQLREFIEQARKKNLLSDKQAEEAISQIDALNPPSRRLGW